MTNNNKKTSSLTPGAGQVNRWGADWGATRAAFQWRIPTHFNIARACCSDWAERDPTRVALIDVDADLNGTPYSYGDLDAASTRLANIWARAGIHAGDRIALYLPQGALVMVAHFAAYKLAAIALPLFTLFGPDALAYRLQDSGARVVVTDAENLPKLLELRADCSDLALIMAAGYADPAHPDITDPMRVFTGAPESPDPSWGKVYAAGETDAETPAVMIYTSGTTGNPKGVLHAHRFLIGHLPNVEAHHGRFPQPRDCGWTPADWAWIGGLMDMAMPCLYFGVPLIAHRMRKFDAARAYELIAKFGVRNLFVPPTALKMMRQAPAPAGLDIRTIGSGGEALGREMLAWAKSTLGVEISEFYGQTECNLITVSAVGEMPLRPGSMGQASPGFEVCLLRTDGTLAGPGEMGEIAVRRPNPAMFLRYWNKPDQTAAKFVGDWMRTGDLATLIDGYFTFASRDDDVITSAGYRVGPSEIEICLGGHADVVMAAVIGVPDPERTEAITAYVVARAGADMAGLERRLIDHVRARLSPHVAPRSVIFVDDLPMTATGKIMRRALRGTA